MQTTKRRSAQAWRDMVARFAQSGLTEAAFCEGEGISAKLFHRWRTKRVRAMPRAVVDKPIRVAPSPTSTGGFVDLGSLDGKLKAIRSCHRQLLARQRPSPPPTGSHPS